jgi:hypothetical protein
MERTAQCHCGSLRIVATGDPERVYLCHCKACQRRTGTAFHFGATYPKEQVRLDGERKIYERDADSGNRIRFHFCPNCGSTLYWERSVAKALRPVTLPPGRASVGIDRTPVILEKPIGRGSEWPLRLHGGTANSHLGPILIRRHRPAGRAIARRLLHRRSARMCQCQDPGRRCSSWVNDSSSKPEKSAARPAKSQ